MFWFDGLLSVPGIGIRIKPSYKEANVFQEKLLDFLEYLSDEYDDIEVKKKEIWGFSIASRKSNFLFDISRKNIVIKSRYSLIEEAQPGKPPKFVMSEVKTCSELIDNISDYFKKLIEIIKDVKGFEYNRIGIFTDTNLDEESLPPGITTWIENLGKTLVGELTRTDSVMLVKLNETDSYRDQCHHFIAFDQLAAEEGYHLKFDWQRVYNTPIPLDHKNILQNIEDCKNEAFAYFQKFGEGGLYED